MAAENGRADSGLTDELFRHPYRFAFFQAVRLLHREAIDRARDQTAPPRASIGQDWAPADEVVRLRASPTLSFPAGELARFAPPADEKEGAVSRLDLTVNFMGLTGPMGVLPQHYTTLLVRRGRLKDFALRDWLDLFNHRFVSLFYRAWEKYRLPFAYERYRQEEARDPDPFTQMLFCLVGFGTRGTRGRMEVDDPAFLFYAGHYAHSPRSAAALEGVLADFTEVPAQILQAWPQWLRLDPDDCSYLPNPEYRLGRNCQMGVNVVAGERVHDVQSKFRIRLGPLTYEQFERFMPSGDGLRPLSQLARTYVGPEFDFDVQLVLMPREVPWARLSDKGTGRPQLGWNTWVRSRVFNDDVDDAVFCLADV